MAGSLKRNAYQYSISRSGLQMHHLHLDGVVSVGTPFDTLDLGSHRSVGDYGSWSFVAHDLDHGRVKRVEVFTVGFDGLEPMTLQSLGYAVSFEVLRWMTTG